ncbi:hypothetical protein FOB75_03080 [Vibrio parahaemolyticus]|nr:hypothetical protein FOB75_03080 [Vibrio parahaemolyticus]
MFRVRLHGVVAALTKRLRRIHNAWQFQFDSTLVFTAQWFRLGGSVVHHLTRRYAPEQNCDLRGEKSFLGRGRDRSPAGES